MVVAAVDLGQPILLDRTALCSLFQTQQILPPAHRPGLPLTREGDRSRKRCGPLGQGSCSVPSAGGPDSQTWAGLSPGSPERGPARQWPEPMKVPFGSCRRPPPVPQSVSAPASLSHTDRLGSPRSFLPVDLSSPRRGNSGKLPGDQPLLRARLSFLSPVAQRPSSLPFLSFSSGFPPQPQTDNRICVHYG